MVGSEEISFPNSKWGTKPPRSDCLDWIDRLVKISFIYLFILWQTRISKLFFSFIAIKLPLVGNWRNQKKKTKKSPIPRPTLDRSIWFEWTNSWFHKLRIYPTWSHSLRRCCDGNPLLRLEYLIERVQRGCMMVCESQRMPCYWCGAPRNVLANFVFFFILPDNHWRAAWKSWPPIVSRRMCVAQPKTRFRLNSCCAW